MRFSRQVNIRMNGANFLESNLSRHHRHCSTKLKEPMEFERVAESDLPEVSKFLCSIFGLTEATRNFNLEVLRWKYITPHPYWDGSRSYCIRQNGEMVAHGCVVPTPLLIKAQTATSCGVIDWAGSPTAVGAGALIYQSLFPSVDVFLAIGGSKKARKVIPKLGLNQLGELEVFSRIVRPMKDFANRPTMDWRSGAHLARNTVRLLSGFRTSRLKGWAAQRVDQFDETLKPVFAENSEAVIFQHNPSFLNYLLACPAATMEGYTFHSESSLKGYCLLSRYDNKCHIADLSAEELPNAYALALQIAAGPSQVSEVIATASTIRAREALIAVGFSRRESIPVFARDPQHLLTGCNSFNITSVENDFFYL